MLYIEIVFWSFSKKISIFLYFFLFFLIFPGTTLLANSENNISSNSANVNYYMPWPGILPDNPLFFIKTIRDKIVETLISNDHIKKIEFDLIEADKTIYESKLMGDKGKFYLAKKSALKGENYFTKLVTDYKWAYWYKVSIPKSLDNKINNASIKHRQVFSDLMQISNDKTYQQLIDFSKRNDKELIDLKVKKKP